MFLEDKQAFGFCPLPVSFSLNPSMRHAGGHGCPRWLLPLILRINDGDALPPFYSIVLSYDLPSRKKAFFLIIWLGDINKKRMTKLEAGEMARCLQALAAVAEGPDSVPSTHVEANKHVHVTLVQEISSAFLTSMDTAHTWNTGIHVKETPMDIRKKLIHLNF